MTHENFYIPVSLPFLGFQFLPPSPLSGREEQHGIAACIFLVFPPFIVCSFSRACVSCASFTGASLYKMQFDAEILFGSCVRSLCLCLSFLASPWSVACGGLLLEMRVPFSLFVDPTIGNNHCQKRICIGSCHLFISFATPFTSSVHPVLPDLNHHRFSLLSVNGAEQETTELSKLLLRTFRRNTNKDRICGNTN